MSGIPIVLDIVDDEPDVRRAISRLLRSAGYTTRSFGSGTEFLGNGEARMTIAGCIILDLAMPGLNGLELQDYLIGSGCHRPIIFLTGNGDISTSVRAMKAGAVNFLTKPVDDRELLQAVVEALGVDAAGREHWTHRLSVSERLGTLTPRERQVFELVTAGQLNKQIAARLGTVEKTIKVHRARMMRKMNASSIVELVQLASLLNLTAEALPVTRESAPEAESNMCAEAEPEHSNC